MFLELDGHGPHYAQLIRAIKAGILNGRLTSGMRLPPTRTLALELGLSRITVLTAYEQLRADGFIKGCAGAGSYVCTLKIAPALRSMRPRRSTRPRNSAKPSTVWVKRRLPSAQLCQC